MGNKESNLLLSSSEFHAHQPDNAEEHTLSLHISFKEESKAVPFLGMTRSEVQASFQEQPLSGKRAEPFLFAQEYDLFPTTNVITYYGITETVDCIEFWSGGTTILCEGVSLLESSYVEISGLLKKYDRELFEDEFGCYSRSLGIGVAAPLVSSFGNKPESVAIFPSYNTCLDLLGSPLNNNEIKKLHEERRHYSQLLSGIPSTDEHIAGGSYAQVLSSVRGKVARHGSYETVAYRMPTLFSHPDLILEGPAIQMDLFDYQRLPFTGSSPSAIVGRLLPRPKEVPSRAAERPRELTSSPSINAKARSVSTSATGRKKIDIKALIGEVKEKAKSMPTQTPLSELKVSSGKSATKREN